MKILSLFSLVLVTLAGCTSHERSPDEIREQTARATSTAARDAKAAAQGVVQGLKETGPININKADESRLQTLPGIDQPTAHRIVEHRPYADSYELVKDRIISRDEYNQISNKIEAH
jgi:DNA uptake protein ComE-like DNA-binding protein